MLMLYKLRATKPLSCRIGCVRCRRGFIGLGTDVSNLSVQSMHTLKDGKCTRCGCSSAFIERFSPACDEPSDSAKSNPTAANTGPRCPKCRSYSITGNKAGFGLGKAVVGGVALGPAGLLAGFFGSRKIYLSCLQCGHTWKPVATSKSKR